MHLLRVVAATGLFIVHHGVIGAAPQGTAPSYAPPAMMPAERAADTYAIYATLLPGNVIEWGQVPRTVWLVEDTTSAEPLNSPCGGSGEDLMNPHHAIKAPPGRQADLAQLLADFDAHCHDRYLLDAASFQLKLPVKVLDQDEKSRYVRGVAGYLPPSNDIMRAPATPDAFKGAAGLHRFSAVYFNPSHTLAMTEIGMYCGSLCGNWGWAVLERTSAGWRVLPWMSTRVIS